MHGTLGSACPLMVVQTLIQKDQQVCGQSQSNLFSQGPQSKGDVNRVGWWSTVHLIIILPLVLEIANDTNPSYDQFILLGIIMENSFIVKNKMIV